MVISQTLYDKLVKKKFYKFICSDALYNCFIHYGELKRKIIDVENLVEILNKYKIFLYSVDTTDYEIYNLLHREIHHGDSPYIELKKPTVLQNKTLWLDSGQLPNDLLSDTSIIESNVNWETIIKN